MNRLGQKRLGWSRYSWMENFLLRGKHALALAENL
jgi:hypothetical protein